MLISLSKQEDLEMYLDFLHCQEIFLSYYEKTGDESLLLKIKECQEYIDKYKRKIDTYDYTEDDIRRARLDNLLNKPLLPPVDNPLLSPAKVLI